VQTSFILIINNKKVGKFSLIVKHFQETLKSGKISKPFFPYNLVMLILFSGFDKLSAPKNTNAPFITSEEVIKIRKTYYYILNCTFSIAIVVSADKLHPVCGSINMLLHKAQSTFLFRYCQKAK